MFQTLSRFVPTKLHIAQPFKSEAKKTKLCLQGILVSLAVLVLMISTLPSQAQAKKQGGTLKVGIETALRGFDSPTAQVIWPTASGTMLEPLFWLDPDTRKPIPHLGKSMEMAKDAMSWTIKVVEGVKFHDGTPFNAEAVAFNYTRLLDPTKGCRCRAFISTITKVEALDSTTVKFHLKHPWAAFPGAVTGVQVIQLMHSPTAIKKFGKDYNRNPVGTGPFKFVEWRPGDRLVVERNENYWKKGLPLLDKLIIRPIPDQESRYASLLSKQLDIIWTDRPTHILKARKDKNVSVKQSIDNGALTTFLNHSKPPLDDPRVRTALQLAEDNALFVKATRKGVNPPISHPYGDLQCPGFSWPKQNIAKAKELIKAYGKPVKVTYTHTTTARGKEAALIRQQMWKKIGVDVETDPVDQATLIRKVVTSNFMIAGWRIVPEGDPYVDIQTVGTFYSKSPANYGKYNNPMMDKLVIGGRMTLDPKKRAGIYCKVAGLIAQDVPIIYNGANVSNVIFLPDVKGVETPAGGFINTREIWLDR